jgi:hypothetical protein
MVDFSWDNNDYQDDRNFDPVPKGLYRLRCLEAKEKATNNGKGVYISAQFEIVEGPYAKRRVFHNFNIENPSEQAQRIGRSQVSAWARACGKPNAGSTDQLLEVPFMARLGVEEQEGYDPRNNITGFVAAEGTPSRTQEPKAEPKPTAPKAPASGQRNPWDE